MRTLDSKVVSAAIRSKVRPLLHEQGFSRFTGRTAWRFAPGRVEVVNFQSFNSYTADVIGCTTYSFALNLGCYLTVVPDLWGRIKRNGDLLLPQEYECHFRAPVFRSFEQPELKRRDIWFIDSEGGSLPEAMHDVRMALLSRGAAWFEQLRDDREVLRILREEPEDMKRFWGFGNDPSPMRHLLSGYVALAVGETEWARTNLTAAAESSSFSAKRQEIEAAMSAMGGPTSR